MLSEIKEVRQIAGEPRRRWFTDEDFDLIVWLDEDGQPWGFQLCYDKRGTERALTWRSDPASSGWTHERVDAGEIPGRMKMTPILVPDGVFDQATVAARFRREARGIDPAIADFVLAKLMQYPGAL